MTHRPLGKTGVSVSELGFGAAGLGNEYGPADPAEGVRAVHAAIDQGISFFDVAPYYGRTLAEERLGVALEGKRHKVFLATKCGRYDIAAFDFSPVRIRASIDESLRRLRTDHLDLFQAHDVEFVDRRQIIDEAIPTLREIQRQGKARLIGITGLQLKVMGDIATAAPVDTILSYCRYNLMLADLDDSLGPFTAERGIGLINASPLHMGILSERGPRDWHPAPEAVKQAGARVVQLCLAHGRKPAEVALRFCLDYPRAATTVVGMSTVAEVEENLRALSAPTDPALLEQIRQIVAPVARMSWHTGLPENWD
jgi:L-galactose dehydrogenase